MRARDRREGADQIGHVPAVEDRADVEHRCGRRPSPSWRRRRTGAVDARRNHVNPRGRRRRGARSSSPPRELRDRDDRAAPLRGAPAISRGGAVLRARENHSGCATNETSWIATTVGTREAQRRGVGRREEDVEVIARRDRRQPHLLPPGVRPRPATTRVAKRRASRAHGQRLGRVEHELVAARATRRRPLAQQPAQVAADAGRRGRTARARRCRSASSGRAGVARCAIARS